jgi:hypothetical protein
MNTALLHLVSSERAVAGDHHRCNHDAAAADLSRKPLTRRALLNSERIAARYGSYAVRILKATDRTRVASLVSMANGCAICRTLAIARFPPKLDTALALEHAAVLAGGSMAAVFAMHGWEIRKSCHRYDERSATTQLAQLMAIPAGTQLAEHAYMLHVFKDGRLCEYATLVEVHHPDYLRRADLVAIYGPGGAEPRVVGNAAYRRAA